MPAPHSRGSNSLDETSRLWVEESVVGLWAQRSAGCSEALNVVVGGEVIGVSIDTIGAVGGCGGHDGLSLGCEDERRVSWKQDNVSDMLSSWSR
jgi:hypothetical protein